MSRCMAISYDDGEYVELPPEAPAEYGQYDYGSYIADFWPQIVALGREIGAGDLDAFVCPESDYLELDEIQEEIEIAEEEGGGEVEIDALRSKIRELLPSHDPRELQAAVRVLIDHLEKQPESFDPDHQPGDSLAETALTELRAYDLALSRAAAEERRVFIDPI